MICFPIFAGDSGRIPGIFPTFLGILQDFPGFFPHFSQDVPRVTAPPPLRRAGLGERPDGGPGERWTLDAARRLGHVAAKAWLEND